MTLKSDAEFVEKLTCGLKNETNFEKRIWQIFTRALESLKLGL